MRILELTRVGTLVTAVGMVLMGAGAVTSAQAQPNTTSVQAQEEECDDGDERTSVVKRTIDFGPGPDGTYWLSVPPGGVTNAPLLVSLHGGGQKPNIGCLYERAEHWSSYSIDSGRDFVLVYPEHLGPFWDLDAGSEDVDFVRTVVDEVQAEVSIDPSRVYATGWSAGAWFGQRVACDAEDLFASVAVYAGGQIEEPCELSRGIAVGFWHGDADDVVDIDEFGRPTRDDWAARESCTTRSPEIGEPTRVTYSGCLDNIIVDWTVLPGQTHDWPSGDTMRDEMWTLFDAFPLPLP